jgi:hypothetical protein
MNARLTMPWLRSAAFDGWLVIAPAWLVALAVLAWPTTFGGSASVGPEAWLLLVVGLDVTHVYATLFRTYLDPRERGAHGGLLTLVPVFCWALATGVHAASPALFWTLVAYTAVFHFIRQQYGLMKLYGTVHDLRDRRRRWLDGAMVGAATLYPLLWWHAHLPRSFAWFVDGDFLPLPLVVADAAGVAYACVAAAYLLGHGARFRRGEPFNLPRQAVVGGTALAWYVGIVRYDTDLAFTVTNVVGHAVPYLALVWVYGENREALQPPARPLFVAAWAPLLLAFLVSLSYLEEGLWDGFVWRDHGHLFRWSTTLPVVEGGWRDLVVPLLILPQLTHYVLDGFIWRLGADPVWRETLLWRRRKEHA